MPVPVRVSRTDIYRLTNGVTREACRPVAAAIGDVEGLGSETTKVSSRTTTSKGAGDSIIDMFHLEPILFVLCLVSLVGRVEILIAAMTLSRKHTKHIYYRQIRGLL